MNHGPGFGSSSGSQPLTHRDEGEGKVVSSAMVVAPVVFVAVFVIVVIVVVFVVVVVGRVFVLAE